MRSTLSLVIALSVCLFVHGNASAQTTTLHLHTESSSTVGLMALKPTGPDQGVVIRNHFVDNTTDQGVGVWDTAVGVPNQSGVILQGSVVTFTVWMRKTSKWGVMYPKAFLNVNYFDYANNPQGICDATGTTPLTQTMTAYTFSCTAPLTQTIIPSDRLAVWLFVHVTQSPGVHTTYVETGFEGVLNGADDSRVTIQNPVPVSSLQPNCPGADPTDLLPDDDALNACLSNGGTVILNSTVGQGYVINYGLQITHNNTTLIGNSSASLAYLTAGADLRAPMLKAGDTISNYTVSYLRFNGDRGFDRFYWSDCTSHTGNESVDYEMRTHGYNLQLKGDTFLAEQLLLENALCGSAMEVAANHFTIRNNDVSNNGFEESDGIFGGWSDGITIQLCRNGAIYGNQLMNNTDVDLIVGPTDSVLFGGQVFCDVRNNTISHPSRYGFAGLMEGFNSGGGDHGLTNIIGNTVTASLDKLAFGIMIGEHPWPGTTGFTASNAGKIVGNSSSGAVVPLAIDGINAGEIRFNTATGAQGTNGFLSCSFSADYTAAHYGLVQLDPGFTLYAWDNLCQ